MPKKCSMTHRLEEKIAALTKFEFLLTVDATILNRLVILERRIIQNGSS